MGLQYFQAFITNFLGDSQPWFKKTILAFLIINPFIFAYDPFIAGWVLVIQFIFTLAMALECYPLQSGGLLAIQAVMLEMTTPEQVLHEIQTNLEVILLLIFMVAGIFFMKNILLYIFSKMLTSIRSKANLSLMFCAAAAFLSAFLDALTVIAVIITVSLGFFNIYHRVSSGKKADDATHDTTHDKHKKLNTKDLELFRSFLRSLVMHAGVGTALGGVCTMVGEPQNLIIASNASWNFIEFAVRMAPVTMPAFAVGLIVCYSLEKIGFLDYGSELPVSVREVMLAYVKEKDDKRTNEDVVELFIQGCIGLWLIFALATHIASVGLIGLSIIILATALNGITKEHDLGKAFEEALPFTALLAVFFVIVGVIIDQNLFSPVFNWALTFEGSFQLLIFYVANGILSMMSDNVFVGTVYINEAYSAFLSNKITRDHFDMLAVAINTGTNLPSVATPNGQAAFLFLLTSALAPLIRLSYIRMVLLALPYTIALTLTGMCVIGSGSLEEMTDYMYDKGWINHNLETNTHQDKAHSDHH
jgi:NhaB family Na+:H+ antiporter